MTVSDNFKSLATANGRYVYCKITAGGKTFLDDKIIEFDLDDVVHPDRFTIGTACANRFGFSVVYNGELEVHDEVRPFISFDNKEWCPLGVFYVAKRYVRGGYASIICYDKMNDLDVEYDPTLRVPTTAAALLKDVCKQAGLVCNETGAELTVKRIPDGCTMREMIGLIASLSCSNAKIDREGKLVFKHAAQSKNLRINEKNCFSIRRNMSTSFIAGLIANGDGATVESGSSSVESAVEMYNPLMTQELADELAETLAAYKFYGAELEMQGLPYLEAGDNILLEEGGVTYPITLSEISCHYGGGLTARVRSRTTDPEKSELQTALEKLNFSTEIPHFQKVNNFTLAITSIAKTAAEFEFTTDKRNAAAILDLNYTMLANEGTEVKITTYVNDTVSDREVVYKPVGGRKCLEHYRFMAENLPKGSNRITVRIQATTGTAQIAAKQAYSTLLIL